MLWRIKGNVYTGKICTFPLSFSLFEKKNSISHNDWALTAHAHFVLIIFGFSHFSVGDTSISVSSVTLYEIFSKINLPMESDGSRSFRTQVISYPRHFVLFWSIRTHFYIQFVISYPVWSFRTYFYFYLRNLFGHFVPSFFMFRTQVISYLKSFRTHFSHFVPRSFLTYFKSSYEMA